MIVVLKKLYDIDASTYSKSFKIHAILRMKNFEVLGDFRMQIGKYSKIIALRNKVGSEE